MTRTNRTAAAAVLALATVAAVAAGTPAALAQEGEATFRRTATSAQADLDQALAELSALRERISAEKLPLTRELGRLENALIAKRTEVEDANRALDTKNLDLTNLRKELDRRQQEKGYLANLLDEYIRNFETRIHVTELQRYSAEIEAARNALNSDTMSPEVAYRTQAELVETSLDRLLDLVGGTRFDGQAVAPQENGAVRDVTFALVGPIAVYGTRDGSGAGLAEQMLGSLQPNMVPLDDPQLTQEIASLASTGQGTLPFDPSLGNALKVEDTKETLIEHISKGGPVMVPILLLAAAALLVALVKWFQLSRVRTPSERRIKVLFEAVKRGDRAKAGAEVRGVPGPTGEMLSAGVEHLDEPKELIEEVMYEKLLETRLRLESWLPFVAMSASAAPLLGLLGTVTGMINTFKLITVFGSGDAKTLSSGISEALVTTEFGLIVAIPSLLLYAFLSRKAKRMIDRMEKTAVSFLNRISPAVRQDLAMPEDDESGSASRASAARAVRGAPVPGGVAGRPVPATDH